MEIRTQMVEVEYCLICNTYIGKGNDPALCKKKRCQTLFDYECAFNKFTKELTEKQEDLDPEFSNVVDKHLWEMI